MKQQILNKTPRLLTALVAIVLTLSVLTLPAVAAPDPDEAYTTWSVNEAGQTITATFPAVDNWSSKPAVTKIYRLYTGTASNRWRYTPIELYKCAQPVKMGGKTYDAYLPARAEEILILQEQTKSDTEQASVQFYCTDKGAAFLDSLADMDGKQDTYRLMFAEHSTTKYATLNMDSQSWLKDCLALPQNSEAETEVLSLSHLRYAPQYTLWAMDSTYAAFGLMVGCIYDLNGTLYYLDVQALPSYLLDQEGNPNYACADFVTLYALDETLYAPFNRARSYASTFQTAITPEISSDIWDDVLEVDGAMVNVAYNSVIFLGILLPVAPVVLGLALPRRQKKASPSQKRWYILAIIGGAWMLLGSLLLVLLLIL